MGWTGLNIEIPPLTTIFKKMYCHKCGERIKKKTESTLYYKGDIGYTNPHLFKTPIGMDKMEKKKWIYFCQRCGNTQSCKQQIEISKLQKKLGRNILTEEESEDIETNINLMF